MSPTIPARKSRKISAKPPLLVFPVKHSSISSSMYSKSYECRCLRSMASISPVGMIFAITAPQIRFLQVYIARVSYARDIQKANKKPWFPRTRANRVRLTGQSQRTKRHKAVCLWLCSLSVSIAQSRNRNTRQATLVDLVHFLERAIHQIRPHYTPRQGSAQSLVHTEILAQLRNLVDSLQLLFIVRRDHIIYIDIRIFNLRHGTIVI